MKIKFRNALLHFSLEEMKDVLKSDIHNHASRGGKVDYISQWAGVKIDSPERAFHDILEMQIWFRRNIKRNCPGIQGYLKCLEAAFVQAKEDNIHLLAMSFGIHGIDTLGGIDTFVNIIDKLHQLHAPETLFYPELALRRESDTDLILHRFDEILDKNWFTSIDICGQERAQPITSFKQIYRKAKQRGLKLKAHVGEFGNADDIREAVEELELSEVHHGIAAAKSSQVMRWLSEHKIQLNICPTSNLMMGLVNTYAEHPIKKIVSYGIPVTINTDDLLIFNQSVSEEFLTLYKHGVMSIDELETARQQGLHAYSQNHKPHLPQLPRPQTALHHQS